MNELLAQLTPQERRIVVAIGLVVIIVLNLLFVWPHFGEWRRISNELVAMRGNIQKFNKQIALDINPTNGLQKQLAALVRQEGAGVMDKQVQLQGTIMTQAHKTGVYISNYNPGSEKPDTNGFFEEESIRITVDSQEPQLIDFLYNIGGDPAMIRVSELELQAQDQNRYRLKGTITLTANYAKRAPVAGAAPAVTKPALVSGTRPGGPPSPDAQPPARQKSGHGTNRVTGPNQRGQPFPAPTPIPRPPFIPQRKPSGN